MKGWQVLWNECGKEKGAGKYTCMRWNEGRKRENITTEKGVGDRRVRFGLGLRRGREKIELRMGWRRDYQRA